MAVAPGSSLERPQSVAPAPSPRTAVQHVRELKLLRTRVEELESKLAASPLAQSPRPSGALSASKRRRHSHVVRRAPPPGTALQFSLTPGDGGGGGVVVDLEDSETSLATSVSLPTIGGSPRPAPPLLLGESRSHASLGTVPVEPRRSPRVAASTGRELGLSRVSSHRLIRTIPKCVLKSQRESFELWRLSLSDTASTTLFFKIQVGIPTR